MNIKETKEQSPLLFPDGDLSLQEHLDLLGMDASMLNFHSKVPDSVIKRALQGGHITLPHAQEICRALSSHHGASPAHAVGIQPGDIKGLKIWKLDEKHHKSTHEDEHPHKHPR